MGMCNLTWPGADKMLAEESVSSNVPMCVSMASSTSLEKMYEFSKGNVWLQLYNFQDEEFVMELLDRAERTGYKVAILTVDVDAFCSWSACRINNLSKASILALVGLYSPHGVENSMCRKFSLYDNSFLGYMKGCPNEYLYAIAAIVGSFARRRLTATHLPLLVEKSYFFSG